MYRVIQQLLYRYTGTVWPVFFKIQTFPVVCL
jgi:hypothetical protein